MTAHVTTGTSRSSNESDAALEAVSQAVPGGPEDPADLLLVFATTGYDQEHLLQAVAKAAGDCPIVGCSGEGVIDGTGSDEGSHAVSVMAWRAPELRFHTVQATGLQADSEAAGRALADKLAALDEPEPGLLLLFPDGLTVNTSQLLAGLSAWEAPGCPVAGGTAGDAMALERTFQYHGGQVASDSVTALLIGGPLAVETAVSHGCQPIGREREVTQAQANTVLEIDGRPAFEVFKEYTDDDPEDLRPEDIVHMCFGQLLPGSEAAGYDPYIIRTPLGLDHETGGLHFPVELPTGTRIQMTRRDPEQVSKRAADAARDIAQRRLGQTPLAVLQFDCAGRGRVLFGSGVDEHTVAPLQAAFPEGTPWLGFHSYGEIAPLGGPPRFHNYTVALLALYPEAA